MQDNAAQEDGFTRMVAAADAFFTELAANNRKDWFEPRKSHYLSEIRKPGEFFAEIMAEELSRLTGQSLTPKVFRIYRDVRFSKDKSPYNTHLHMIWTEKTGGPLRPAYFFGVEPGALLLGLGVFDLKGEALTRYRGFADRHGADLLAAMDKTGVWFSDWGAPVLKRVPKPYPPDHPQADLLRRKSLVLHVPAPEAWRSHRGGLVSAVRAAFATAEPVAALIRSEL